MTGRERRRFTIADVMILVVATAVGSLFAKSFLPGFSRQLRYLSRQPIGAGTMFATGVAWLHGPGSCVVVPLMLATLAIRLRRPRPSWRRITHQPGFAACAAMFCSLIPGILLYASIRHRPGFARRADSFDQVWYQMTHWTEPAVLGAWFTMGMTGRSRSEPGWIDRLGRLLGSYWVAMFVSTQALRWISKITSWF